MDESQIVTRKTGGRKWKITAIITIILTIVLAAATGFFVWQYLNQKAQIGVLQNDVVKAQEAVKECYDSQAAANCKPDETATTKDPNVVTVEELTAAYRAEGNDDAYVVRLDYGRDIKNSSVVPWQTVRASVGNPNSEHDWGYAMFYREGQNGGWKFGYSGNGTPGCNDSLFHDHRNIAKAFADNECTEDQWDQYSQSNRQVTTTFKEYYDL